MNYFLYAPGKGREPNSPEEKSQMKLAPTASQSISYFVAVALAVWLNAKYVQ